MRKLLATLVISCWATLAYAQKADLIVTNAKIVTLDGASTIAQAIAVREGKIVGVGEQRCHGRPGRAPRRVGSTQADARSFRIDRSLYSRRARRPHLRNRGQLDRRQKRFPKRWNACARRQKRALRPGSSWPAAGANFNLQEKRRPTLAEVMAAVPDNPAWIQLFYSAVLITPKAQQALGVSADQLPEGFTH